LIQAIERFRHWLSRRRTVRLGETPVWRGSTPAPGVSGSTQSKVVDLRQVPALVINCGVRPDRRAFMERQLSALGLTFSFADGVRHASPTIGCAQSHLNILERADLRTPFMILEDDCQFTSGFRYRFELPADTDALYLGVSSYGILRKGARNVPTINGVRFAPFGPSYLRVFNMLGTHAVLYLSERYRREAGGRAAACRDTGEHIDVALASLQETFLVLTPNDLVCCQSKHVGGNYRATRHSLLRIPARAENGT
jgi:hypothetical protein